MDALSSESVSRSTRGDTGSQPYGHRSQEERRSVLGQLLEGKKLSVAFEDYQQWARRLTSAVHVDRLKEQTSSLLCSRAYSFISLLWSVLKDGDRPELHNCHLLVHSSFPDLEVVEWYGERKKKLSHGQQHARQRFEFWKFVIVCTSVNLSSNCRTNRKLPVFLVHLNLYLYA